LTFITYQDELREIWRDNITATKSLVLFQLQDGYGDGDDHVTNEHYYHHRQFITKIPQWNSKKRGS
jgi:hypothetical protein